MSGRSWKRTFKSREVENPDTKGGSIRVEELGLVIGMENRLDVTTNVF
jgi:hypothetical protein